MFAWYKNAIECYVFLPDVHPVLEKTAITAESHTIDATKNEGYASFSLSEFLGSVWFTRGWCLQELLAPRSVNFFNNQFNEIGSKSSLAAHISVRTGISGDYLSERRWSLQRASVAERMRWASYRQTSREEDVAYCLLGIFDVNMPLLYGEGQKAFMRLQAEIIKKSTDESIFAWRAPTAPVDGLEDEPGGSIWSRVNMGHGLLARSPMAFTGVTELHRVNFEFRRHYEMTNRGIRMNVAIPRSSYIREETMVTALLPLNCVQVVKDGLRDRKEHRLAIKVDLRVDASQQILEGRRKMVESSNKSIFLADVESETSPMSERRLIDKFSAGHHDYEVVLEAPTGPAEDWQIYFPQDGM